MRLGQRRAAVSPVIAVILLVAITVILAAVVYITVTALVGDVQPPPPWVGLTKGSVTQTTVTINVHGTSGQTQALSLYQAVLVINGTVDTSSKAEPLGAGTFGKLTFTDLSGEGRLTIGDTFVIQIVPDTSYSLTILYRDQGVSGSIEWNTG